MQNSFYFKAITEIEVTNEVTRLVKLHKSSLELSNPSIIFHVIDLTVKPFTFLLNWSVEVGIFPDCLKISKVVPIHKKGNKDDVSNYRPISLLSVFEKIFERLVYNRLSEFWNKYSVLYNHQYGFRENHSTTVAIIEITDLIYKFLDEGNYVLGLYIDISKAVDTVSHEILLRKLFHYGLRGSTHKWLTSYLLNRKQYVSVNNVISTTKIISYGVPQGSVLGPLLFLI